MKVEALIEDLKQAFPELDPKLTSEFYGYDMEHEGIWLRKAWAYDLCERVLAYDLENELAEFIEDNGWHIEPYDSETFMAWKN